MAAARTALDILKTHGDRTATRLRSLVEHFAAYESCFFCCGLITFGCAGKTGDSLDTDPCV